jgi:hypothetical protein
MPQPIHWILALAALLGVLVAGCGGGISAESCDDITDETVALLQRLIDDIDEEFGDLTVQEILEAEGDLPSLERFAADAATIDELAAELGCSEAEITAAVDARVDELVAETDVGQFIIDAIRSGGL